MPLSTHIPLDFYWRSYVACLTFPSPLSPPQPQPTSVKGPPDPYIKLYVTPDLHKKSKQKSKVVESTHNPTYNETVSIYICTKEG